MIVQSTQFNVHTLKDQLICPVTKELLSEAVTLVPCAHKVQKVAAEQIFGTPVHKWMVQSVKPCPVCKVDIVGYIVDDTIRNIVSQFSIFKKDQNLPEKCMSVARDVHVDIPYPGKPAKLIHHHGTWELYDSAAALNRSIHFKSSTKGSLLEDFSLFGYKSGKIAIQVKFSNKSKEVDEYLKSFDLYLDYMDFKFGYKSDTNDQLKNLFKIIAENNEIPESHFEMIRDIVERAIS